jgi:hypothetical protein
MLSTAPISSRIYADPREDWLAQHTEAIIDPERPIVDAHHHLWHRGGLCQTKRLRRLWPW